MNTRFKKGFIPWNKGKKHTAVEGDKNPAKRNDVRAKISKALKGKKKSPEHIAKMKLINLGRIPSIETRQKRSLSLKGEKCWRWKGGITGWQRKIRESLEYRVWRTAVFTRDNFTCIWCGYKSHKRINGKSDIQADHIKPFCDYPELRLAIDNGRTLCIPCHRTTKTWGRNKNNINKIT